MRAQARGPEKGRNLVVRLGQATLSGIIPEPSQRVNEGIHDCIFFIGKNYQNLGVLYSIGAPIADAIGVTSFLGQAAKFLEVLSMV